MTRDDSIPRRSRSLTAQASKRVHKNIGRRQPKPAARRRADAPSATAVIHRLHMCPMDLFLPRTFAPIVRSHDSTFAAIHSGRRSAMKRLHASTTLIVATTAGFLFSMTFAVEGLGPTEALAGFD